MTHYALKSIHLNRCHNLAFVEELKNEVEILKRLDHPNIVRAIETFLIITIVYTLFWNSVIVVVICILVIHIPKLQHDQLWFVCVVLWLICIVVALSIVI